MSKFSFLQHGEVYHRRVRLNRLRQAVNIENKTYYSVRDIQRLMAVSEVSSVTTYAIRYWLRHDLLRGFKRKYRRRWYISQRALKDFIEKIINMNEEEVEDPLCVRYGIVEPEKRRIRRSRQRSEPRERNEDGTFKRKRQYEYNHDVMLPRLQ